MISSTNFDISTRSLRSEVDTSAWESTIDTDSTWNILSRKLSFSLSGNARVSSSEVRLDRYRFIRVKNSSVPSQCGIVSTLHTRKDALPNSGRNQRIQFSIRFRREFSLDDQCRARGERIYSIEVINSTLLSLFVFPRTSISTRLKTFDGIDPTENRST